MYFLVALGLALISTCLWFFLKDKKPALRLDILSIIYGAAALMWLIDCIASAAGGDSFLSFEFPDDGWISLWTFFGGLAFWGVITLVIYLKNRKAK